MGWVRQTVSIMFQQTDLSANFQSSMASLLSCVCPLAHSSWCLSAGSFIKPFNTIPFSAFICPSVILHTYIHTDIQTDRQTKSILIKTWNILFVHLHVMWLLANIRDPWTCKCCTGRWRRAVTHLLSTFWRNLDLPWVWHPSFPQHGHLIQSVICSWLFGRRKAPGPLSHEHFHTDCLSWACYSF